MRIGRQFLTLAAKHTVLDGAEPARGLAVHGILHKFDGLLELGEPPGARYRYTRDGKRIYIFHDGQALARHIKERHVRKSLYALRDLCARSATCVVNQGKLEDRKSVV